MDVTLKRVYEPAADDDGFRVLVDRLWPRGVSKERARLDLWLKEVAPSPELRQRWHHDPEHWDNYAEEYRNELQSNPAVPGFRELLEAQSKSTLLYGAADPERNHARVLLEVLSTIAG
ncbi:uncharacterized protein YeaO (DUF488 family) [Psychromicrobium silvestre]|uniref:Uncharacterized protein YeaO (DUF488 family) n=1 Tax=Psychromicrobium silvestre TaxID=1645614 RepID=A0A7Y9S883_9MICC|nr:DUF488 family protein [Psychromicrobium silvestre]NYE96648.1 uncharacterized protein YeaO (DUF488 family) [Psychromicrobium silvestre]